MHTTTPLTAEDATRLHMGRRDNPMVIEALLTFGGRLSREAFARRFEARTRAHPRFRSAVVEPRLGLGLPRWREIPGFDLRAQIHGEADTQSVEDFVCAGIGVPLDPTRPLWRVHVVPRDEGTTSVLVRVHHALADGLALLALLRELADEPDARPPPSSRPPAARLSSPRRAARRVAESLAAAGELALARADPPVLRAGRGARKVVAFTAPLSLAGLTAAAKARRTTLGALLLAAVAGALRGLLSASGVAAPTLTLHALFPVPARRGGGDLGNHYGSLLVPLPLGAVDPDARVATVTAELERLRRSGAGASGVRLASAAGRIPRTLERLGVAFFSRRASVVVSVARGPAATLHVEGVPLDDLVVWAPSPGSVALGVTLVSYAGRVRVAVGADARALAPPRAIAAALEAELARLLRYL